MHLNELKALHVSEVLKQAEELEIENTGRMRKQELMFAIIKKRGAGEQVFADGVLEILPDGFGFLRSPDTSYTASTDDIYISPSQVRRFNLHTGDMIEGEVRIPKDGERYFALNKLDKVNGGGARGEQAQGDVREPDAAVSQGADEAGARHQGEENITGRVIDIIAPSARASAPCWWPRPRAARR
jgi:transcription termination factor Rho